MVATVVLLILICLQRVLLCWLLLLALVLAE